VWRRRGETASAGFSAAALYSVYSGLYSEAVVSSVASAVALVEVGRFREAVEYVQKAAKALYEAAMDVFEHVKITVQRLVELFVKAVTRVLAWIDEHKAHLFLMAAGAVALSAALNLWGLIEHGKLAYAASLTLFIPAGIKEHPREEALRILREAPDLYERFKEVAKAANAGRVKLAEPWESLRVLIMPKPSEEEKLMRGGGAGLYSKYREDENYKRALFYATLALEEAFGFYRSALAEYAEGLKKAVRREEVGEELFKRVVYMPDLGQLKQLAEEESRVFEDALKVLRERLNEYAVRHGLGGLLNVEEGVARGLTEAEAPELSEFGGVNFGTKAYAALIAYREYVLGRRGVFGKAAWYWLEVGGSAWLLYYAPVTAYIKAKKAEVGRPVAVEEMVAEAFRRLFLKPGADHYRGFVELLGSGRLALMLEDKTKSSYVFELFRLEEGGLKELGVKLRISKVGEGEGIVYTLELNASWREFFAQKLEVAIKAAEEVGRRLPVEDLFSYMVGWVDTDVAIARNEKKKRVLAMGTSHLWQLAETHALFGWSNIAVSRVSLTLEGPKPQFQARTSLEKLDRAIRRSAEGGWVKMLGDKEGLEDLKHVKSWEGLKQWVAGHWGIVVDAAVRRLREVLTGEELEKLLAPEGGDAAEKRKGRQVASRDKPKDGEKVLEKLERKLKALRDRLNNDKIAREIVAPALLLIQAERLGVNERTLRYFGAVVSGAIGGDGYVSAAMGEVGLASGEHEIALLWGAVLAAHGIKTKVAKAGGAFRVVASGGNAVKLAGLYFRYGPPLLEGGDDMLKNHKLSEAVKLAAEGLDVSWEGLRLTEKGLVAAYLTISEGGAAVKYNVYLRENKVELHFVSTDRCRVELAARLLRLAGVTAEVKKVGGRDVWYVIATTDRLAAGRDELRKALAEVVKMARDNGWVDEERARRWLEKLERGRMLKEDWPKYRVQLTRSGALDARYRSANPDGIEREAQRLRDMGLEEGRHFSVKMPKGRDGYVRILREGLAYAAWLSVHGSGERQRLAAMFVEYILQRAREEGDAVYKKAKEIVKEGKERGSLRLEGFEKEVEVDGRKYVVKVIGGGAEFDEGRSGKKLLRIKITAEVGRVEGEHTIVDRVVREYTITFGRRGRNNAAVGYATAKADAPGGREADAERYSALIEVLTGRKPKVYKRSDGKIEIMCYSEHLEGFMRFAELADAIERWLEETGR
jgi:tetratricopeptide (TPR) repeat protein